MKVLLRKNVRKLGVIGDIVDVKKGYARNYLIPQHMGVAPTAGNIRKVEEDKARYLAELARQHEELAARAKLIEGREVTISARANEEGHLYGSIGPAQIAAAMSETGVFIEPDEVQLPQPIRQLDKYDVTLELAEDITAVIHVWVVPVREGGEEGQIIPSAPQGVSEISAETTEESPAE